MTSLRFFQPAIAGILFAVSPMLLAATPLAQDYTVVFHNPDPEYYVEGPGLARLEDGALVAAVPVVPRQQWSEERRAEHSVTHILRSDDGTKLDLKFTQYAGMPGGHLEFCVLRDDVSKLFWATANLSADSQGAFDWQEKAKEHGNFKADASDRRFLMLHYSADGLNWFPAGCVAQAAKISQSFMYARPVTDGDDLAIIARSSVNAPNQHDADYCTFHRVHDFRRLALNLFPEPEGK